MPRNPNKRHCQKPGCRNWAMRGHAHCRPHLDHELGPRGAGAPRGNLNAFKTGANITPLSKPQIRRLAHSLVRDPDNFRDPLVDLVDELSRRVGYRAPDHDANSPAQSEARSLADPEVHPPALPGTTPPALAAVVLLNNVTQQLISVLSEELFAAEMDRILSKTPPAERATLRARLWAIFLPVSPLQRLLTLRRHLERKRTKGSQKQLPG